MRVVGTKSSKDNLCGYCQKEFCDCITRITPNHLKFGDGKGNDNVIECSEFAVKHYFNNYPIVGKPELGIIKKAEASHCI
jgi:hypothetical protein